MINDEYKPSIKKNIVLSLIAQAICYLSPLIVSPYLSRVLGAENVGIYAFSFSYAQYFITFAAFGFINFGAKMVSNFRADYEARNRAFWNIFFSRLPFVFFSALIYVILITTHSFAGINDYNIMLVFVLLIVSTGFDISFFFRGIEKFSFVSFATAIINLLYIGSIFIFVKTANDLFVYTLLKTLCTSLVHFLLWIFAVGRIGKPMICKNDLFKYIKGSFSFFLLSIIMGLSTSIDQTLIGIFSNNVQVAYYQQSLKIIVLLTSIISAVSPVMLSRITLLISEKNQEAKVKELTSKALTFSFFILAPLISGLYVIGGMFIPLYFGNEFIGAVPTFFWMLPISVISALATILISSYYYPVNHTKRATLIIFCSTIVNIILSIVLLIATDLGAVAASIASVVADTLILFALFIGARKNIDYISLVKELTKIMASIGIMSGALVLLNEVLLFHVFTNQVYIILLDIAIGGLVYFLFNLIFRESVILGFIYRLSKRKAADND